MDTLKIYNDPIISKKRTGGRYEPYKKISENLRVFDNQVMLTEIPNRFNKIIVTDGNKELIEIDDGILDKDTYEVDYPVGLIRFDSSNNGKTLNFKYLGEGAHFFPDSRIYLTIDKKRINARDKFADVDRGIVEQKNRVDTLMRENPQPSEVVDIRIDRNGKVFDVARDRINSEQAKIEEAYVDAKGKIFESLKDRIDSEELKIEEATFGDDGRSYYSLRDRFDKMDRQISLSKTLMSSEDYEDVIYVQTLGNKQRGDGGDARYSIVKSTSATDGITSFNLLNGYQARLLDKDNVNLDLFELSGNGVADDTSKFEKLESIYSGKIIDLRGKSYKISKPIVKNYYVNGKFIFNTQTYNSMYGLVKQSDANTFVGEQAGIKTDQFAVSLSDSGGYANVGIGTNVLTNNTIGWRNTAVGWNAMRDNVEGQNNTAFGDSALERNIGAPHPDGDLALGSRNTALGSYALRYNTEGIGNIGVGRNAGHANTTGRYNTAVGTNAYSGSVQNGNNNKPKTADYNVAVGYNSLFWTNANFNVAVGTWAGYNNETGRWNTYAGHRAGFERKSGDFNIGIGGEAGYSNESGDANIAIGHMSLHSNNKASNNVALGVDSMRKHNDPEGTGNTAIGTRAMYEIKKGHNNTAIGWRALATTIAGNPAVNYDNCIGLGANSKISGSDQCQIGNPSMTVYTYGAVQSRSDSRDKAEVRDSVLGLDFIKKLRPVDFKWEYRDDYIIEHDDGTVEKLPRDGSKKGKRFHHGLIAQEVKQIISDTGVDFGGFQDHSINSGEDLYTIGYEELIAPLINSIKTLSNEIVDLRAELKTVKDSIKSLQEK